MSQTEEAAVYPPQETPSSTGNILRLFEPWMLESLQALANSELSDAQHKLSLARDSGDNLFVIQQLKDRERRWGKIHAALGIDVDVHITVGWHLPPQTGG